MQIGMTMPPLDEAMGAFMAERAEIDSALSGRTIAELVHLPLNQSAEIDVTVRLIVALASPAYIAGSPLYPLLMARQITLALRHGLCEQTSHACAAYAFLLGCVLGEPAVACAIAFALRHTGESLLIR